MATPIAASQCDHVTLGLQSLVAQGLFRSKGVGLVASGCPVDQMIRLQHKGLNQAEHLRGLVQTVFGRISVIVTLGGGGWGGGGGGGGGLIC